MTVITMPRLAGETDEGTIVRWLKADGDAVSVGDELVEIESDAATETLGAAAAGVLTITAGAGATVAVGAEIATLGQDGEPAAAGSADAEQAASRGESAAGTQGADASTAAAPATQTAKGETTVTEPTRAQSLVARRAAESRATVPAYTLRSTVDMRAAAELLAGLAPGGQAPTTGDLIVKACAEALTRHPDANGAYRDGRFECYARINVGVAVHGAGALMVPTIFDADRKGLGEIAAEMRALAGRVTEGSITAPELAGATFTVSDLGALGVRSFEAIPIPGQAAILAAGAVEPRAVARDGAVAVRETLDLELSCDHRILLPDAAARLLGEIRTLLESPERLAA